MGTGNDYARAPPEGNMQHHSPIDQHFRWCQQTLEPPMNAPMNVNSRNHLLRYEENQRPGKQQRIQANESNSLRAGREPHYFRRLYHTGLQRTLDANSISRLEQCTCTYQAQDNGNG